MKSEIVWTKKADYSFGKILNFLEDNYSDKALKEFIRKTYNIINLISENPSIFARYKENEIRKALIHKHASLFYRIKDQRIELLLFWDNRQNPVNMKI